MSILSTDPQSPTSATPVRKRRIKQSTVLFWLAVGLPTILGAIYFGLIASDVYISESRFVVRSPQRQAQSGFVGAILQGTGFSRSQDDTYSVHDFILSRDALAELNKELKLKEAYSSRDADFINRFPGLEWDDSFEAFFRYYRTRVSIDYDTVSSISVLRVRAFTAEDAKKTNDLLLKMGERLVNNLNDRSRQDLIKFAEQEIQIAEEKAKNAAGALSVFRGKQSVFDPEKQSSLQLQGVAKLQEELLAAESRLAQVKSLSPSNPQISVLAATVTSLQNSIRAETGKVAGSASSLTVKSVEYERLQLERGFAEKQLASAMASLETARSEAQRKQLYLERLVQPHLPDKSVEPRRIRSLITVFAIGLFAWGILTLLVASIREHAD
jgi:capsular polysaccharide transport system permease protein